MSYVQQSLTPGESVVSVGAVHWWVYVRPVLCVAAGIAGIVAGGETLVPVGYGLVFVGLALGLGALITSRTTELAVTTRRVIAKTGLIGRTTLELSHGKVESLAVNQSIPGRILGFGTVLVRGTGGTITPITNIVSPIEFRRSALEAIEGNRNDG